MQMDILCRRFAAGFCSLTNFMLLGSQIPRAAKRSWLRKYRKRTIVKGMLATLNSIIYYTLFFVEGSCFSSDCTCSNLLVTTPDKVLQTVICGSPLSTSLQTKPFKRNNDTAQSLKSDKFSAGLFTWNVNKS